MINWLLKNKVYLCFTTILVLLWGMLHLSQHRLTQSQVKVARISNQLSIEKQNNNILANQLKAEKEKFMLMVSYKKDQEKKLNEDERQIKTALKTSECSRVNLPLDVVSGLQ